MLCYVMLCRLRHRPRHVAERRCDRTARARAAHHHTPRRCRRHCASPQPSQLISTNRSRCGHGVAVQRRRTDGHPPCGYCHRHCRRWWPLRHLPWSSERGACWLHTKFEPCMHAHLSTALSAARRRPSGLRAAAALAHFADDPSCAVCAALAAVAAAHEPPKSSRHAAGADITRLSPDYNRYHQIITRLSPAYHKYRHLRNSGQLL